jgi:hypothetical protein
MNPIALNNRARRAALRAGLAVLLGANAVTAFAGAPLAAQPGAWCGERCGELVTDWSLAAHQVIVADNKYINPLPATRALAMMHLAMHDAVNAATPRYETYALKERDTRADPAVAAAVAAHDVLLALYPKQQSLVQATLARALLDAGVGPQVDRGKALGSRAAAAVIARRAADGHDAEEKYAVRNEPGRYRFVPDFDFIVSPQWRRLQPFALQSPSQFRSAPPPALTSAEYTRAFEEVRAFGAAVGSKRSEDESNLAAFWYELSDIGWNRIARVVARQQPQDLADRARLFALLNVAMADGYIAGWDSKIHHDFWRPVSAIRLAATDGNPATQADAKWSSFLVTPPIQDHPSTHSVLGAAAAGVLAGVIGRDDVAFNFTSTCALPANPVRHFASFSDAARENADSRIFAGLHFRFATDAGLKLGDQIARYTLANTLRPLH